jgi:hypothetical protein
MSVALKGRRPIIPESRQMETLSLPAIYVDPVFQISGPYRNFNLLASLDWIPHNFTWILKQLFLSQNIETTRQTLAMLQKYVFLQCCGSGIRCLFEPWIWDTGWVKIMIRIRDEQPGSYF